MKNLTGTERGKRKNYLLGEVKQAFQDGLVDEADLLYAVGITPQSLFKEENVPSEYNAQHRERKRLSTWIQYGGGTAIIAGIFAFFAMFWHSFGFWERLLLPTISGLVFYISGNLLFLKSENDSITASLFHLISVLLLWISFSVLSGSEVIAFSMDLWMALVALFLSALYAWSFFAIRYAPFVVFSFVYSVLGIFSLFSWSSEIIAALQEFAFVSVILGSVGILVSHYLADMGHSSTARIMGVLGGLLAIVPALFALDDDSSLWVFLFPGVLSGVIYMGLRFKSGVVFGVSLVGAFGYFAYLSSEFFSDLVSWPILLLLVGGLLFVGGRVLLSSEWDY